VIHRSFYHSFLHALRGVCSFLSGGQIHGFRCG
jgi:hypothetical protein